MKILRMDDVIEKTGLSRQTILRRERDGTFPKMREVGKATIGWIESEIDEWIKTLPRKTNQGAL